MTILLFHFPVLSLSRFPILAVAVTLLVVQTATAQVVNIPDSNLRQLVRETLQLPDRTPITQQEMLRLEFLDAGGERGITDLTGLQYATNLWGLDLYHNPIVNIGSLAYLTKLEGFNLWGCQVVDLGPLRNLTNLRSVILGNNQISDITPLANLVQLTNLGLDNNQIRDISPIANLILLEELRLNRNTITDITPLIGLKNLKKLYLAENPIHDFSSLGELEGVELDLDIDLSRLDELNLVVEIPDSNLEQAIRETLALPHEISLTQLQMVQLTGLETGEKGIIDLTGIEYATNLHYLNLGGNQIRDIRPLAGLIHLSRLSLYNNPVENIVPLGSLTNLTYLNLAHNGVETLEPLAGLIRLRTLDLFDNRITDIAPIVNMTALTTLILTHNQVSDLSPLASVTNLKNLDIRNNQASDLSPLTNHPNLEKLDIRENLVADFSPLDGLNLIEFRYDEVCDIAPLLPTVGGRIENRSFPSIFQAWDDVVGLDYLTSDQRYALHDLHWSPFFDLGWHKTATEPTYGVATSLSGDLPRAREIRQRRLELNPNLVFLVEVRLHNHFTPEAFPPDSDFWFKGPNNQIAQNGHGQFMIDFMKPEVQDLLVKRILAVARCGLYDGVMLDGFNNHALGFLGRGFRPETDEEIVTVITQLLHKVRTQVHDDFLILVNANRSKLPRYAEFVNGTFMETLQDHASGYTHNGLKEIENTLFWAEKSLRQPQINCLEGWGIGTETPDSPNNLRWMRVFTTMSLTHSDGYVLYNTGEGNYGGADHEHIWYDFWDANLGRPVGEKAQHYGDVDGLFIREFTNGWTVYNRSGAARTISLPAAATPVSDRASNAASQTHILPDLDGEIYLTTRSFADVNGDGYVNVLDLVQVANGLGKSTPDPNGDGVVNILDLVFVAQQFSQ